MKKCSRGKSCSATCINKSKKCLIQLPEVANSGLRAIALKLSGTNEEKKSKGADPYADWNIIAKGYNGQVAVNPEGTKVVKTLLTSEKDGKKGTFGKYEVKLATKMGELGYSPRVFSHSDSHIEMEMAKGKPLWKSYEREENEPVMNAAQAKQAGYALKALHKMGFSHGDAHSQQFLVDGNNVKLVDFGLSLPFSEKPTKVMQDLAKINSLVQWDNPALANDPYFSLVSRHLNAYRELGKSRSKASEARREEIAQSYMKELSELP